MTRRNTKRDAEIVKKMKTMSDKQIVAEMGITINVIRGVRFRDRHPNYAKKWNEKRQAEFNKIKYAGAPR